MSRLNGNNSVLQMDNLGYEAEFSDVKRIPDEPTTSNAEQSDHQTGNEDMKRPGVFRTFTQEAGVSGVKYIGDVNVSPGRRLLWLLIVLFALSGLLYQITRLIVSFAERPVNVNIKFEEPDTRPKFPAVTICNNNMFEYDNLVGILGGVFEFEFIFPYLYTLFTVDGEKIAKFATFLTPEDQYYGDGQNQFTFIDGSAPSVENMLRSCSFGGLPCGPENFTKVVTNYGICYTFNSDNEDYVHKVRNAGQQYGLQLLLFVNERQYLAPRSNVGFRLMVHGQDEIPNVASYGLSLSPGTASTIGLKSRLISNLGSPYGNCVEDVENNLKYFDGAYSLSKCWMECETDYAVEQCGCRYFYMPGNATYCSPYMLQSCYFSKMEEFALKVDPCKHCEEPCVQTVYGTKLSYSSYPSTIYANLLAYSVSWPCDEALAYYLLDHSSEETPDMFENIEGFIIKTYYTIEANGQNISELIPSAEFHSFMLESLMGRLFVDVFSDLFFEVLLHTLASLKGNKTDSVNSIVYNETKDLLTAKYINFSANPWRDLNATLRGIFAAENLTSDVIEYLIDSLFTEYYVPLFEEVFVYGYSKLTEMRDNKTAELRDGEPGAICKNYMLENLSKVTVYFEDLKVNTIVQQPGYHSFNLICDIGGSLGLFFGASMVTFLEIIDFFIVQFWMKKLSKTDNN
ncbi:acid-sensing ion channel 1A-like [Ptychodera flava]|uniref:acid-sensing ion channel 1A-like n=1 Tax=Ptychodera flava TaxID=63121 RepID=UPI00396A925C